jgi:hypothetical protein
MSQNKYENILSEITQKAALRSKQKLSSINQQDRVKAAVHDYYAALDPLIASQQKTPMIDISITSLQSDLVFKLDSILGVKKYDLEILGNNYTDITISWVQNCFLTNNSKYIRLYFTIDEWHAKMLQSVIGN